MLVADKPLAWTSHDVVAVARRAFGIRRIGHGGTLDPLARGVLPLLVGRATRFVERLHTAPKAYAALVLFGAETETDDREGALRRTAPPPTLATGELDAALGVLRGEIEQVPPAYAAIKVGGRRAYARSRGGEMVVLPPRRVRVERLAIASWEPPALRLLVVCSTGTYIRSLARDIGRWVGSAAHLAGLARLAVGALELEGAVGIETLRSSSPIELTTHLRPADDRLLALDRRFHDWDADRLIRGWEG